MMYHVQVREYEQGQSLLGLPVRTWNFTLRGSIDTVLGARVLLNDICNEMDMQNLRWNEEDFENSAQTLSLGLPRKKWTVVGITDATNNHEFNIEIKEISEVESSLRFGEWTDHVWTVTKLERRVYIDYTSMAGTKGKGESAFDWEPTTDLGTIAFWADFYVNQVPPDKWFNLVIYYTDESGEPYHANLKNIYENDMDVTLRIGGIEIPVHSPRTRESSKTAAEPREVIGVRIMDADGDVMEMHYDPGDMAKAIHKAIEGKRDSFLYSTRITFTDHANVPLLDLQGETLRIGGIDIHVPFLSTDDEPDSARRWYSSLCFADEPMEIIGVWLRDTEDGPGFGPETDPTIIARRIFEVVESHNRYFWDMLVAVKQRAMLIPMSQLQGETVTVGGVSIHVPFFKHLRDNEVESSLRFAGSPREVVNVNVPVSIGFAHDSSDPVVVARTLQTLIDSRVRRLWEGAMLTLKNREGGTYVLQLPDLQGETLSVGGASMVVPFLPLVGKEEQEQRNRELLGSRRFAEEVFEVESVDTPTKDMHGFRRRRETKDPGEIVRAIYEAIESNSTRLWVGTWLMSRNLAKLLIELQGQTVRVGGVEIHVPFLPSNNANLPYSPTREDLQ